MELSLCMASHVCSKFNQTLVIISFEHLINEEIFAIWKVYLSDYSFHLLFGCVFLD